MIEIFLETVDFIQYGMWAFAWTWPTDGMMRWYGEVNNILNNMECAFTSCI